MQNTSSSVCSLQGCRLQETLGRVECDLCEGKYTFIVSSCEALLDYDTDDGEKRVTLRNTTDFGADVPDHSADGKRRVFGRVLRGPLL
jgi:hypothetical protein